MSYNGKHRSTVEKASQIRLTRVGVVYEGSDSIVLSVRRV